MTTRDDWLTSAMSDDRMVADLLFRLNHPSSSSSSSPSSSSAPTFPHISLLPPPQWGIRQPRSRMAFRYDAPPDMKRDSARNSPTTPLAWSAGGGGASSSGTADGSDESALPACRSSDSRSKEIATLRTTFMEHTATNESLKRMKLDFDLNSINGAADGKEETVSALVGTPVSIYQTSPTPQDASSFRQASTPGEEPEGGFLLPDLNMTPPSERDFS